MNLDLSAIATNSLIAVPIVIAVVQAIKLTGWLPDHFSPLASIGIGIIIGWLGGDHTTNGTLSHTILVGAIYGLMASGLYSGVKVTMLAHQQMKQEKEQKKQEKKEQKKQQQQQAQHVEYNQIYVDKDKDKR